MSSISFKLYAGCIKKEVLADIGDFKIVGRIMDKVRFADIVAKIIEELQDIVNTGRKYGREINIGKSKVMELSRSN